MPLSALNFRLAVFNAAQSLYIRLVMGADGMAISVDIADRLYDYTDEEKAAEAVAEFQTSSGLDDEAVVALWANEEEPLRRELERRIFDAVDANGSIKRAQETIPVCITLLVGTTNIG